MYYFRGKWKRSKYDKMCDETSWGEVLFNFFMCAITCGLWVFVMMIFFSKKDGSKRISEENGGLCGSRANKIIIDGDIDLTKFYPQEKKKEIKESPIKGGSRETKKSA